MKLPDFRAHRYGTRRYFPLIALIAAISTLILLLVVYTSNNLRVARQRLERSLLQEGLTLIRAIEAGDRTGMRMRWDLNNLQVLVEEFGKAPKVAYIRVISAKGNVLAQYQDGSRWTPSEIVPEWLHTSDFQLQSTTLSSEQSVDVFEITTRVLSHSAPAIGMMPGSSESTEQDTPQGMMGRGMMRRMMENNGSFEPIAVIQLGLKMTELQEIERRDVRNALMMFAVFSLLGSAALYVIMVTQNYHTMNRAFQTMTSYTQHVVESMANGLISVDTEGKIVTMNRQAHRILAIPGNETVEGQNIHAIFACENFELSQIQTGEKPIIEQEVRCMSADQTPLPLNLSASVLTNDTGQHLGSVLLFRDLREVKALEEQVKRTERLASVGRLAAGMAHEIRNPLGALKGFLQYFQRKLRLPEQDHTYFSVMVNEVDRLNAVITNLLDFARPKDLHIEPCHPKALLNHVLTLVERDIHAKQAEVSLDIPRDLPEVPMDREQMTQVVLNILLNAIQALETHGQIQIQARLIPEKHLFEILITDNGQGIAAEDLPRIFDPFFTTRQQGTGLGLAIAHSIVEQHHGEIAVQSMVGSGTTFRIRLPLG